MARRRRASDHRQTPGQGRGEPAPTDLRGVLREGGRALALLLGVALALKLLVVAAAQGGNPLVRHLTSDPAYYLERARGIAGRFADPLAQQPYHLPPLYPWILRLVPGAVDGHTALVGVLQAVAGTAALGGVYVWSRRRLARTGALLATALTLAYAPITFFETKLLGDSLAFDALVLLLVLLDGLAARGGTTRAALAGLVTGAVALLRPQALLLPLVLLPTLERRRWLPFLLAFAGALLPSAIHNANTGAGFAPVSDNGSINQWLANGPDAPVSGTFGTDDPDWGDIARQAPVAATRFKTATGRAPESSAVSAWFRQAALSAIAADPGRFLTRVGWRALALIEAFQTGIVTIPQVERSVIPPLTVLPLRFPWLLAAAAAAWILGASWKPAPRAGALGITLMVVATALLFFHYERFRLPLVPLLAAAAAAGLGLRTWPGARRVAAAVVVAAGVIGLGHLTAPHHAPTLANGWTSLGAARLSDAAAAGIAGHTDRADALARAAAGDATRALDHQPSNIRARLLAARAAVSLGAYAEARRHLDEVERRIPGWPEALEMRIQIRRLEGSSDHG